MLTTVFYHFKYVVCYFSVILSLSNGFKSESEFKSEFQKIGFLGFLVIYLKDYEYLNTYICVKHRKLCYIYEIIAKNAKKGNICTEKCTIHQIDKNEKCTETCLCITDSLSHTTYVETNN